VIESRARSLHVWRLGQPSPDLVESERVVPEELAALVQERRGRRCILAVPCNRRPFAIARLPRMGDRGDHRVGLVAGVAGDHEGLGERKRDGAGVELHDE